MEISRATNIKWTDSEENFYNPKRKRKKGRPQLRQRDQYTLQDDGRDHAWPNP
jgi:hypothetical protein